MTPQDKAKEIIERFKGYSDPRFTNYQKQCALICVDEQLKLIEDYSERGMLTNWGNAMRYWQEVKTELNNYGE